MAVGGAKPSVVSNKLEASHHNQPDPSAAGGTIVHLDRPDILSPLAVGVWDLVAPPLIQSGVLREDDLPMLVECVEAWAASEYFRARMWERIAEQERTDELVSSGGLTGDEFKLALATSEIIDGQVKRARTAWLQSVRAAASLSADLGLGPVARVRLGLAKVEGASLLQVLQEHAASAARQQESGGPAF